MGWGILPEVDVVLLLLATDVNIILQFCQLRSLPVDVLLSSLDSLGGCSPSHDLRQWRCSRE
jgi:hypothetical protein